MTSSLLDRDFSPPTSFKDAGSGDRWRLKGENASSERWRANNEVEGGGGASGGIAGSGGGSGGSGGGSGNVGSERWSRRESGIDRGMAGGQRRGSSRDRSPRRLRDRDGRRGGAGGVRNDRMVYIANIPYDVRWMELKDLVREKAGEVFDDSTEQNNTNRVNFVELLEDRKGKSKGAAVVEFREKESVQRCVDALHRYPMNDRLLTAKEIRDPVAFFRKVKEDTGVDFLNGLHGGTATANLDTRNRQEEQFETYGLSPAFLRQLHITGPLTNRVFVSNLLYNVQSGRVTDYFSLAGKVTWVDLQLDKEGRSKGMAVVQFTHPIEAVQAISMLNNQRVFDRQINVKMDKFDPIDDRKEGELPVGLRGVGMGLGANGAPLGDVSSIISSLTSSTTSHNSYDSTSAPYTSQSAYQGGPVTGLQPSSISSVMPFSSTYTSSSASLSASNSGYSTFGGVSGFNGSRSIIIKNVSSAFCQISSNDGFEFDGIIFLNNFCISISIPDFRQSILLLPLDYTWQIVRDRVQQFGPVDLTEMIAPGCAKVTFAIASDAERARKSLQNTTVEGRVIGVEFLV
ncbi:Myelin expression factor 2 [Dirofilaria immitis]|nr:Myelin expression factor 2 [Dirofilaria immitis]